MKSIKKQIVEEVRHRTGSQVNASLVKDAQYEVWRDINAFIEFKVSKHITKRIR